MPGNLTNNYNRSEFECNPIKCGCGTQKISIPFVKELQKLHYLLYLHYDGRRIIGKITSGCRCKIHNKKVGGTKNSYHIPVPFIRKTIASDVIYKVVQDNGSVEIIPSCIVARIAWLGVIIGLLKFKGIGCYYNPYRCHFDMRMNKLTSWIKKDSGEYQYGTDFTNVAF